jgi:hypothetical protein
MAGKLSHIGRENIKRHLVCAVRDVGDHDG